MTAKQLPDDTYLDKIYTMLAQIEQEEGAAMDAAARAAYASIDGGGLLHVFSTGHSHMIVEEMFYRSGGLVPVNPILSDELMLHTGAITSTHMERMPGKAAEVLGKAGLRAGDTILISSNTNPVRHRPAPARASWATTPFPALPITCWAVLTCCRTTLL
jgi:uncharacterized phosphosugar-binding protein